MPKYFAPIDLNQNELQNAKLQNLSAPPASPGLGQAYFDTTQAKLGVWNGTSWAYVGSGAVASVFGRTGAVVAQSGDYTAAQVGALPLAGGTMSGAVVPAVVALTDAATVAVNAALGNDFRLTFTSAVGASRAIGAPANPVDGLDITFLLSQAATGGPYTVTWNAAFDFGTDGPPTLTTTASKRDLVAFKYVAAAPVAWVCMGWKLGF